MATRKISAADLARAERVRRFGELHVRHMKDRWAGAPFQLEPFQWENMVLPVYGTLDPKTGRRKFKRALFGLPRWNGKSELTALLHLYHLFGEATFGGEQYAFATTRAQASIIFDTAKRMVNADPLLRATTKVYRSVIEVVETGAIFKALPFDADTSQGFHPSFASGDEVHVMKNLEMVESMVTGMVGREEGLFVAITTEAAHPGGALDQLRAQWAEDPAAYVYWQGAGPSDDASDPKVWRKANPASWISMQMLESQFRALPLPVFERLHLNRMPQQQLGARAFNPKAWEACSDRPEFDPELPCIVGVDAAPRRDKTAVVLDQRDDQGFHNVKCWTFDADPEAGLLDFSELVEVIRGLCDQFNVTRVVCDPAHLFAIMDQLLKEGVPIEDFPQSASRMVPASLNLYDLVQLGRLRHGGDPTLTRHVLNAGAKEIPPNGWRLTKVSPTEHIDAAVALAMACHISEQERALSGPSFASSGGIWTI